jgi:peptidoglycan/LPS O-acetylase OafA/YrhL|tara:strand:- start:23059 stop:25017 length:1959 start_codon:yes stop_codon:yes gene_type:complete
VKAGYLPHLDGLRAIAVGLVVLHHAGITWIPGGFIGVDVFFVLSGYLITGQIVKNLAEKRFSFKDFYQRRLRRLAPAYLAVALVSLIAAYFILLPQDFIYHCKVAALAFLSLSNFYLANTTGGYFAAAVEEIPLLHTWSLAVEEQYYLVWPVMLIALSRINSARMKAVALLGLFALSVWFSVWYTPVNADRAYYLLPTRFHELLAGGLLAFYGASLPRLKSWQQELVSLTGLAMIIVPALVYSSDTLFPSWRALIPCLGTVMLVYAGQHAPLTGRFLTLKPMIGLGLISYSLYLWHWPIFSFTQYATGSLDVVKGAVGIALAVLLSWLTWKFIEQPFRFKWHLSGKQLFRYVYVAPAVALLVALAVVRVGDGFIGRFGDDAVRAVEAMDSEPGKHRVDCPAGASLPCADILLAGDSHAEHFGDFMSVLSSDAGLTLHVDMRAGCPALWEIIPTYIKNGRPDTDYKCVDRSHALYSQIHRYEYVVLAGYWSIADLKPDRYFLSGPKNPDLSPAVTRKVMTRAFHDSVRRIVEAGSVPVLIRDNPTAPDELFNCSRRKLLPFYDEPCEFPREEMDEAHAYANELIDELEAMHPEVMVIDPNAIICAEDVCRTELDGVPIYRDDDHLNRIGSETLGEVYIRELGNPFSESVEEEL